MKHIIISMLMLLSFKGLLAQIVSGQKKELLLENADTKTVKIMVGDEVDLRFRKPDVTVRTTILSATDSSVVISVKQAPFKQFVPLHNIYSMTIVSQGNLSRYADAMSDTLMYRIEMTNGNEFVGSITLQDLEKIVLKTAALGEITIPKSEIQEMEAVNVQQIKEGVLWFDNPQATRYFWSPNGYGVKKGEAYYQNVWVFFNQFTMGMSDNFSVGLGIVPLFLLGGGPTPVWVNAKFSVPLKKDLFNLGGGILSGTVINGGGEGSGGGNGFGIAYGITTIGTRDKNLSIGLGYGYSGGDWANSPTISVSSMIRTGPRGYFLTENYIIGSGDSALVLISLGGRRIVGRTGIDFGLFMPFTKDIGTLVAIPWLGITTPLGRSKK